jgi:hypothetical protein
MQYKMSKSDWNRIGIKTGWIKEAQNDPAPTKPAARTDKDIEVCAVGMQQAGYRAFGTIEEDADGIFSRRNNNYLRKGIEGGHRKTDYFIPTRERLIMAFRKVIGILKKRIKEAEISLPLSRAEVRAFDMDVERRSGIENGTSPRGNDLRDRQRIDIDRIDRKEIFDKHKDAFEENEKNKLFLPEIRERLANVEAGLDDEMFPPKGDAINWTGTSTWSRKDRWD